MSQSNHELIYIADPMCSWCYGFSPELTEVVEKLDNSISFRLIMGGLRPYNTETMTQLGDFLRGHWEEVNERSGQEFNYGILENESFVYDTEPASRAVVLMRKLNPEKTFPFFKAIQVAFYKENKDTNLAATYAAIVENFGMDSEAFVEAFESEELKAAVKKDFLYAGQLGVRGFPTLILRVGEQYYLIANGYTKAENILSQIEKTLLQSANP